MPNKPAKRNTWSLEVKSRAFQIFLLQEAVDWDVISNETGVPVATLKSWSRKDGWYSKREAAYSATMEKTFEGAMAQINERRARALENIDMSIEIAVAGANDPDLYFRDKKQAFDVLRDYTKLLKDLIDEESPKVMLSEIGDIIMDEVADVETKKRIGQRLINLERSWRK